MENSGIFQTIEDFAKSIGVSVRTVDSWVDRGLLPTHKVGKRRLINLYQIRKNLAAGEPINATTLAKFRKKTDQ
ncbi:MULTISPECIES: helix-turn-helix domain-containing protein [unclassified Endozoicomonas]|uniref:helix-turn-helix domain-containing protein n=1 Tax=unclassified Endozoicomonas TaxID=2644528 RepID=UPI003BB5FFBA